MSAKTPKTELVSREDVLDRMNLLRVEALKNEGRCRVSGDPVDYWEGYVDGLDDLLDAFFGVCHSSVAIPIVGAA